MIERLLHKERLLLRVLIKNGLLKSPATLFSTFIARNIATKIGWPLFLDHGVRIVIDNPTEWMQREILTFGLYEPSIGNLLAQITTPEDLFFDVGANMGQHALIAASHGARSHAFEPLERLAERITQNASLNHLMHLINVVRLAISNKDGEALLYVAKRGDDGSHSLLPGVPAEAITSTIVSVRKLDSYICETQCGMPTIIKIDVEGSEAWVLDGAENTLKTYPTIIIETADRLADQIGETAATVLAKLFERDYRIFRIPDSNNLRLEEVFASKVDGALSNYVAVHPHAAKYGHILELTRQ